MKRTVIIVLAISFVASITIVYFKVVAPWKKSVQPSAVYERCADRKDVEATFVVKMRFDDTVAINVTVVHAVSDEGWKWMCDSLVPVPESIMVNEGKDVVISYLSAPDNLMRNVKYSEDSVCDLVVVKVKKREIYMFHDYKPEYRKSIEKTQY